MEHQPRYKWDELWAGMEQAHQILNLLRALHWVGSTDPVADAAAMGTDLWLREMVAKTLLDNMIYPVAISLDGMFYLMRVRRDMHRDEIAEWLEPRGFHFAKLIELQFFMELTGYQGTIKHLGDYHRLEGTEESSNWAYGSHMLKNGECVSGGWDHGEVHAWGWNDGECFLVSRYGPVSDLPPDSYPVSTETCRHCGALGLRRRCQ